MGLHTWDISPSLKIQYSKVRCVCPSPTTHRKLKSVYPVDIHIFLLVLGRLTGLQVLNSSTLSAHLQYQQDLQIRDMGHYVLCLWIPIL